MLYYVHSLQPPTPYQRLFSCTLHLRYSLTVTDQVSHPHPHTARDKILSSVITRIYVGTCSLASNKQQSMFMIMRYYRIIWLILPIPVNILVLPCDSQLRTARTLRSRFRIPFEAGCNVFRSSVCVAVFQSVDHTSCHSPAKIKSTLTRKRPQGQAVTAEGVWKEKERKKMNNGIYYGTNFLRRDREGLPCLISA